ncbi:AraC family transcriptional regulator [Pontibacillus yanchengensis]|uniref:AraC family transcriptional regulator n=1 Tax=Pontibacillus yanchengensis Y32 TaxID=1385514 RepID=A0A0A2TD20_9BACI|nr:AraC family transcriptional regulator [Pontibacillus yanchengensis]KGP73737.1 AraC family transcriptional regulator [Pontibacillus yanchengensis Y32]
MAWVESLQRAIDYMEANLLDDISIERVAKEACTSVFHFQRMFMILTDMSVGEYVRRRRLTLAAHELSRTDNKIIDIAYKYGYDTPESFSKAFRKQHGITPRQTRTFTGKMQSYNRLVIQVNVKGAEPMQYEIVEKEAFQVVGMKQEVSCVGGQNHIEIPKMWDEVNAEGTDKSLFQLNNGEVKGVLGVCVDKGNEKPNYIDYWIATAHEGDVPEGYEALEVPASKWAVFEVHGPMPDAMQKVWKQIVSEWFPSSGYQHAGTPDLEVYSEEDPASPDLYSEVWIPVK